MAILRNLLEKYKAQPVWVKIGFLLVIVLLAQIIVNWSEFVEGFMKGLKNYGIGTPAE